jgi:hypothetical protein
MRSLIDNDVEELVKASLDAAKKGNKQLEIHHHRSRALRMINDYLTGMILPNQNDLNN